MARTRIEDVFLDVSALDVAVALGVALCSGVGTDIDVGCAGKEAAGGRYVSSRVVEQI